MFDLTIDFETYFDQEYSLGKLTTQEYLEDPRYETIGASIIEGDEEPFWLDGPDLPTYFGRIDWANTNMIGHNLIFDGGILARHYGHTPKLYSCTLAYCRAILGALVAKCSLEHVSPLFGLRKDVGALFNLRGLRYADVIKPEHAVAWERYKTYAVSDAVASRTIFKKLLDKMPPTERVVVDIIIRMFTEGKLVLDGQVLQGAIFEAEIESNRLLAAAAGMSDKTELRSRDKFAALLRAFGVEPPMKVSQATGELTYAFSKDDLGFIELQDHPDLRVGTLIEAKLNASSTINLTRATRLLAVARSTPEHRLQVPLAYSGAHTHRFSGLDRLNLQNIPKNQLRYAIRAPKGYKLVVRDSSQIEARILALVAGQWDLVQQFADGEDVYASFASTVYGFDVNKKDHPAERFIGKTGILGLGYGSGSTTFLHMVLTSDVPIDINEEFAAKVVETYRNRYPQIRKLWGEAGRILHAISEGQTVRFGPCYTDSNRLWLPSGLALTYPQLEHPEMDRFRITNEWHYYKPRYKAFARIFGAKLVENMVQALARIQITDTMLRTRATSKDWHCALQVHDELIYVVPDDEAEICDRYLSAYMNMQPAWVSEYPMALPLANEGGIGEVYGDIHK